MKKMKLRLEALRVESFATATSADARGTVHGNDAMQGSDPIIVGSANELCTDQSYVETCIFYTCGGCTSDDPQYC
jgi:hypothetical protein